MTQSSSTIPEAGEAAAPTYESKTDAYFGGVRRDFIELLRHENATNVLEIGCGTGDTGAAALGQGLARSYIGVEIAPQAAAVARTRLTEVLEGNVERMELPWPDHHFDAVLMSEVLEHLVDTVLYFESDAGEEAPLPAPQRTAPAASAAAISALPASPR